MICQGTVVAFLMSQSAWLIIYSVGSNSLLQNPLITLGVGAFFIPTLVILLRKVLPEEYKDGNGVTHKRNLFYYMCCLFAWSCIIDLIGFLEGCDVIDGYFDFYFEKGEPYLASPFGIWINFWDATVHYVLYLILIYKYDNGQDYVTCGLYWFGSMVCGMFCLTIGALVGSYGGNIHPAMLLNIPYIVLPFYGIVHLLQLRQMKMQPVSNDLVNKSDPRTLFDVLALLGLLLSIIFGFVRGLAALGSPLPFVQHYMNMYEPYILEPGKFGQMFCLFNFMFCLPAQVILAYALLRGGNERMKDLSLLVAGATAQGTFFYLMPAFSSQTPLEFRISNNAGVVILLNLLPVFVSHLVLYRLSRFSVRPMKKE